LKPSPGFEESLRPGPARTPPRNIIDTPLRLRSADELNAQRAASGELPLSELVVQVDVNRQGLNETVIVLRAGNDFYLAANDLERWRLRLPAAGAVMHGGRNYYPASALAGATFELDESRLTLSIDTSPEAFSSTVSALPGNAPTTPVLPRPGGFLNYSVTSSRAGGQTTNAGLFDGAFFTRYGVLTSSVLEPTLGEGSDWRRLETTYTVDFPPEMTSLRFGDSVSRAGSWGRPVRFGGVQYGTNFSTQPGFVPYPLAMAIGQAALPSTVDVFVNNALVTQRQVPPGPFSITSIPIVTGAGDVRLVVRDLLGREQLITYPFYGSPSLLRKGISDYSFEAGAIRRDFAIASDHYGPGVASGTFRRGLTDNLTGELRAEGSDSVRAVGGSAVWRVANLAVLNAAVAGSDSDFGPGHLAEYGLERNGRLFSASFQTTITDENFRQVGMLPNELPRRRQSAATFGMQLGTAGSLSLTYVQQQFRDQPQLDVATASYTIPLGRIGQFNVTASRTAGVAGGSSLFTTIAIPLGGMTAASLGTQSTHSNQTGQTDSDFTAVLQKSLPLGEGWGYRLQAREHDTLANVSAQTRIGTYVAEAAQQGGQTATRISASGGVGTIGGYTFLSRSITDSFAVVRAADYGDVRVLQDNQVVARTGKDGYAVLPRVRAYDRNPIALEQSDLPLDAAVGALKVDAVPYFRSGVFIDFPVRHVRAATFRVVLDDGEDIPSGAVARIEGQTETFPVGLRGQAYVEGLELRNRVRVSWKGRDCVLDVAYPKLAEPLPDLGTYVCRGVVR
jgi:outer membrane usher protein